MVIIDTSYLNLSYRENPMTEAFGTFERLPIEIILEILSYLSTKELSNVSLLNRDWKILTNDIILRTYSKKICSSTIPRILIEFENFALKKDLSQLRTLLSLFKNTIQVSDFIKLEADLKKCLFQYIRELSEVQIQKLIEINLFKGLKYFKDFLPLVQYSITFENPHIKGFHLEEALCQDRELLKLIFNAYSKKKFSTITCSELFLALLASNLDHKLINVIQNWPRDEQLTSIRILRGKVKKSKNIANPAQIRMAISKLKGELKFEHFRRPCVKLVVVIVYLFLISASLAPLIKLIITGK